MGVAAVAVIGLSQWLGSGSRQAKQEAADKTAESEPEKAPKPASTEENGEKAAGNTEQASPIRANDSKQTAAPRSDAGAADDAAAALDAAADADSPEKIKVLLKLEPPGARAYYKGRSLGKPPIYVEIEPGKKKALEVGKLGYGTRRVVVDGSEPEISVGLLPRKDYQPPKAAASAAKTPKPPRAPVRPRGPASP